MIKRWAILRSPSEILKALEVESAMESAYPACQQRIAGGRRDARSGLGARGGEISCYLSVSECGI